MKRCLQQGKKYNKTNWITLNMLLLIAAVFSGCSDAEKAPPAVSAPSKPAQQAISRGTATMSEVKRPQADYTYNPVGRRDPFASLLIRQEKKSSNINERPPLERFYLSEYRMTAVIWGGYGYNAMVEGPDGKGYLIRVGTVLGPNKGVVKKITQSSMVIEEKIKSISGDTDRKETVIELRKKQEGKQ